jgi:hypothetical protein
MIGRETPNQRIIRALKLASLSLVVICLSGTSLYAQSSKKTVLRRRTLVVEPMEITVEYRGQPVKVNEVFDGDADWLKNLTLKLKNRSAKTITYVVLNLVFPETAANLDGRVGMHQIFRGIDPDRKLLGPELRLAPGESTLIRLDREHRDIWSLVEVGAKLRIEDISRMIVDLHTVLFDDGTLFSAGSMYRRNPDPNDPHKWIAIDK